jgi:soluble P-type ATPase
MRWKSAEPPESGCNTVTKKPGNRTPMLLLEIPPDTVFEIEHLILDFNGTIAGDGILLPGVVPRLRELSSRVTIHVITADTNESARSQLADIPCNLKIIGKAAQDRAKLHFGRELGLRKIMAIGNGMNDSLLLKEAALSICVIQSEGAAVKAMCAARIVCRDILDALDLPLNPHRITATLRN